MKLLNGDKKAPKMKERMIVLNQTSRRKNLPKKQQTIQKSGKR